MLRTTSRAVRVLRCTCTATATTTALPVRRFHTSPFAFLPAPPSSSSLPSVEQARRRRFPALPSSSAAFKGLLGLLALASSYLLYAESKRVRGVEDDSSSPHSGLPHTQLPSSITLVERTAVNQLRTLLLHSLPHGPERDYLEQWALFDDWALLRYLRAHKLSLTGAANGLRATASWRRSEGVDSFRAAKFEDQAREGLMYVVQHAHDPAGRALIFNRKSAEPAVGWDAEMFQREQNHLVYTLERAIREMDDRVDSGETSHELYDGGKWLMLLDMGQYSAESATPWAVTRALIDVFRLHYPERLNCAILLDAPWMLRRLCGLLRPFIDKVTREKVLFLDHRESPETQRILSSRFGGTLDCLPVETRIPGAKAQYDWKEYVQTDPLDKPRPTPRPGLVATADNKKPHSDAIDLLPASAAPVPHAPRSWLTFWRSS